MSGGAGTEPGTAGAEPARPILRVVRGRPDDAELAALTAVLAVRLRADAAGTAGPPAPASRWADPAHRLGVGLPGADAWRTGAWGAR